MASWQRRGVSWLEDDLEWGGVGCSSMVQNAALPSQVWLCGGRFRKRWDREGDKSPQEVMHALHGQEKWIKNKSSYFVRLRKAGRLRTCSERSAIIVGENGTGVVTTRYINDIPQILAFFDYYYEC